MTVSTLPTARKATAPELLYLTSKLAALMPFGKVAVFLDEVLPTSTKTHASPVRNRTLRVGKRLERHQDTLDAARTRAPAGAVVLLTVRVHVLNDTLEDAFRHWHRAFRPVARDATVLGERAA